MRDGSGWRISRRHGESRGFSSDQIFFCFFSTRKYRFYIMKGVVILLCVFVAVVTADEECPLAKALQKSFEECKESMNPSDDVLKLVSEDKGDDNKEVTCFQACMANKAGLMKDAKFDIENMENILRSAENPNEEKIKTVVGMMKECKEKAEVSEDECEVAGNYMRCAKEKRAAS